MPSVSMHGKRLLRRFLESLGYDIVARVARNGPLLPVLSVLIEHCVSIKGSGAILQIGANDGVMKDPVHDIIIRMGLPALLVEPLPDLFEQLQANYSGQPNVQFANVAVSNEAGEVDMFRVNPAATDLPGWVQGLASFNKSVLLKHATAEGVDYSRFVASIEAVRVPVVTIAQLLERHPETRNLIALQIDTEGHDFNVVQSAVAAACLPPIINYEHKHLTYDDQVACRELLASRGYAFWSGKSDTLAAILVD